MHVHDLSGWCWRAEAAQNAGQKIEALESRLAEEVASLQTALDAEVANVAAAKQTVSETEAVLSTKLAGAAAELSQTTDWYESSQADLESEIKELKAEHATERDALMDEHQTAHAKAAAHAEAAQAAHAQQVDGAGQQVADCQEQAIHQAFPTASSSSSPPTPSCRLPPLPPVTPVTPLGGRRRARLSGGKRKTAKRSPSGSA